MSTDSFSEVNSTLCSLTVMVHPLGSFEANSVLSTFDVYFAARNKTQASRFSNTFQNLIIAFCLFSNLVHHPIISAAGDCKRLVHPSALTRVSQNSIQFLKYAEQKIPPSLQHLYPTIKDEPTLYEQISRPLWTPESGCWSQLLECTLFCFCFLDLLLEWPDHSLTSVGHFRAFTFTSTSCDSIVLSSKLAYLEVFLLVYINLLEIYPFLPGFSSHLSPCYICNRND